MPSDDDFFPEEDNYCYPSVLFYPPDSDSDYDHLQNPIINISKCNESCNDCKNGCNQCAIGRCYCPNSIHYDVVLDYYIYEGHDEIKISKFDQSLQPHIRGYYHLRVLLSHDGTPHNITIINNDNEYDSHFNNNNNIIINNNNGVSIQIHEIINIIQIYKNRLDNED